VLFLWVLLWLATHCNIESITRLRSLALAAAAATIKTGGRGRRRGCVLPTRKQMKHTKRVDVNLPHHQSRINTLGLQCSISGQGELAESVGCRCGV